MAGTFTHLIYHIVFSTKRRYPMIEDAFKHRLYEYMGGIVRSKEGQLLAIGGIEDHIHLAVKLKPTEGLSKTIGGLKGNSSKWLNEHNLYDGHFSWQAGFGAFSVSESQISRVITYIENQEKHHHKQTFQQEFIEMLEINGISYDLDYIWK